MRKLIYSINLSLDGCCDHTSLTGYDDLHAYFSQLIRQSDVLAYGRKTYELMFPYWADVVQNPSGHSQPVLDFAHAITSVEKIVVFSRTLQDIADNEKAEVHRDLKEAIVELKQKPGRDILLGGVEVPTQLIEMGLVDEYHLVIHPAIVGGGRRLAEGLIKKQLLRLAGSTQLASGCLALHYVRA